MAGTLPLAMAQQVDVNGQPLAGALVYFFVAGTVATSQTVYADFGLTTPLPNPLTCDQTGRVPMFWLADGTIHVRLTDSTGVQIIDTTMQVLGPSSGGGGGGGTIDPTTILSTGDIKAKYGTGPISGFVRLNGLTIGNATSGASERANADTQALFIWLYNEDPSLPVSGGRTGNALNDFNASSNLELPDFRGYALGGLSGMGNGTPNTVLTTAFFGTDPSVLGASGGSQSIGLTVANLPGHSHNGTAAGTTGADAPDHSHSGTTGNDAPDHTHTTPSAAIVNPAAGFAPGGGPIPGAQAASPTTSGASTRHQHPFTSGGASTRHEHSFSAGFTTDNGNGLFNSPVTTIGPMKLTTFYIKL
jgi:hypothetical protein